MKKVIESLRLNEFIYVMKKWMKRNRKDDDDSYNHPFAIFKCIYPASAKRRDFFYF